MADIEKIYCSDRDDSALTAAILSGRRNDDGYNGMIFCRWTSDVIGKAIDIEWAKFV